MMMVNQRKNWPLHVHSVFLTVLYPSPSLFRTFQNGLCGFIRAVCWFAGAAVIKDHQLGG